MVLIPSQIAIPKFAIRKFFNIRKIVEGTRGPFYTIGRSSLPAADTLTRQDNKTTRQDKTTI